MILLIAVVIGLTAGLLRARLGKRPYRVPEFKFIWIVFAAFLMQWLSFYFTPTRQLIPDAWAKAFLIGSQCLLLIFAWVNRHLEGFWLLGFGLLLNLLVISLNGGLMPIRPETAQLLIPQGSDYQLQLGQRLGFTKDIVLESESTKLWFLSDRFVTPEWLPCCIAYSFGDILIGTGAFWLLWSIGSSQKSTKEN
jgi:hypothetical protein